MFIFVCNSAEEFHAVSMARSVCGTPRQIVGGAQQLEWDQGWQIWFSLPIDTRKNENFSSTKGSDTGLSLAKCYVDRAMPFVTFCTDSECLNLPTGTSHSPCNLRNLSSKRDELLKLKVRIMRPINQFRRAMQKNVFNKAVCVDARRNNK